MRREPNGRRVIYYYSCVHILPAANRTYYSIRPPYKAATPFFTRFSYVFCPTDLLPQLRTSVLILVHSEDTEGLPGLREPLRGLNFEKPGVIRIVSQQVFLEMIELID